MSLGAIIYPMETIFRRLIFVTFRLCDSTRYGAALIALGAVGLNAMIGLADDVGTLIEAQTGAHTRVVWVQDQSRAQNDTLARGNHLLLMGLDSRDGKGERPIFKNSRNYVKPLLTPSGDRIVYSDHSQDRVLVVDWDGNNRRTLCTGFALEVWRDPADGTQWVYVAIRAGTLDDYVYRDVFRIQLDNPKVREPIWSATLISPDNFQLSADGLKVAGEFPWPNSGVADLAARTWDKRSTGCWATMAPDNSYVCSIFDGPHRNLQVHSADGSKSWKVNVAPVDLFWGFEVFHPRWSNHVQFMALTGPYKVRGPVNEISGGGPEVEVYLAKFSEDFERIESWVQVTNNQRADFYPDIWIADGDQSTIPAAVSGRDQAVPPPPLRKSDSDASLVFIWDGADRQNEVLDDADTKRACRIEPRGWARFDSFFAMSCGAGFFEPDSSSMSAIQKAVQNKKSFSLEILVTPDEVFDTEQTKCLLEFGEPSGKRITLQQKQSNLELVIHSESDLRIQAGKLKPGRPLHLAITSVDGRIECWIDAKTVGKGNAAQFAFSDNGQVRLSLGANLAGENPWRGRLERVRVYQHALASEEVLRSSNSAKLATQGRINPTRLRVQAQLIQSTSVPQPEAILPYRRALLIHHFRLTKAIAGEFSDQDFLVARWGILDGEVVEGGIPEPGELVELSLEAFEAHPQLASERQLIEVDRFELPMFYDILFPF
jgi:hypothetical protein